MLAVAPPIATVLRRHWYVGDGSPLTATEKLAGAPPPALDGTARSVWDRLLVEVCRFRAGDDEDACLRGGRKEELRALAAEAANQMCRCLEGVTGMKAISGSASAMLSLSLFYAAAGAMLDWPTEPSAPADGPFEGDSNVL